MTKKESESAVELAEVILEKVLQVVQVLNATAAGYVLNKLEYKYNDIYKMLHIEK